MKDEMKKNETKQNMKQKISAKEAKTKTAVKGKSLDVKSSASKSEYSNDIDVNSHPGGWWRIDRGLPRLNKQELGQPARAARNRVPRQNQTPRARATANDALPWGAQGHPSCPIGSQVIYLMHFLSVTR
jgi:hypothetical protein